jgi:hypothetical protein
MKEYAKETGSSLLAKVGLQKTKETFEKEFETNTSKAKDRSIDPSEDTKPE